MRPPPSTQVWVSVGPTAVTDVYTTNKKMHGTCEFLILPFYCPSTEFWLFLSKLSHFRNTETAPETYHRKLLDMEKVYMVYSQMEQLAKNSPATAGDARNSGLIPGSGRSSGEGNGIPLQCSCVGNITDRGAWRATVHKVAESQTRLNMHAHDMTHNILQHNHTESVPFM